MSSRPIVINMIATIVSFVINMGINFILSPYIIESVGVDAYGFIGLANNFINYASIITIALNSMAGRFISISIHKGDLDKANKYVNSILVANICLSIILAILSVFAVINLENLIHVPTSILVDVKMLFSFLSINFVIGILSPIFGVATFALNKLHLNSLRSIEGNIIRAIILISLFAFFRPSIAYLGVTTLIVGLYSFGFNVYYTRKFLPNIVFNKRYFDLKSIIEVGSAGVWNVFNKLSSILSTGLDLLIANLFINPVAMGTLSVSKTVPTLILSIFGMLSSVFAPQLTISYATGDISSVEKQLQSAVKVLGVLSSIPLTLLFVYGDIFYTLWVPTQNEKMLYILSIIGCFELIFVLPLEPLWNIFTITNKIKKSSIYLFINSVFTIIIVFIGLNLANSMEMKIVIIAGVSMIFGVIRALLFLPIYGAKCLNIKWYSFYHVIVKNTFSIIVLCIVAYFIRLNVPIVTWLDLVVVSVLVGLIGLIINFIIIFDGNERKQSIHFILLKINNILRRS